MRARLFRVILAGALSLAFASVAHSSDAGAKMDESMPGMRAMPAAHAIPGMSLYNLHGRRTTQDGSDVPLYVLHGKPVVAAMVYTHCRDVCPLIAECMQAVERRLPTSERDSVQFVLFSLDWTRDTPQQLRQFAQQHRLDPRHWTLFHGNEAAVRELAAALGVNFYRSANGDYQHAIAIYIFDSAGVVRSEQDDLQRVPPWALTQLKALPRH